MNFNDWLTARGFDPAALTDAQRTALQAAYRADQNPDPTPAPTPAAGNGTASSFTQTMDRLRGEAAREERITALVAEAVSANRGRMDELEGIGRQAIADRWTENQTELALLRAVRPQAGGFAVSTGKPVVNDLVLEAALCQTAGLQDRESQFDERTLDAADKLKGMGLLQLLETAARQNGYRGQPVNAHNLKEVARFAYGVHSSSATGPSTINVSGILSNSGNKFARDAFNAVDQSILKIAAKRSVKNFQEITSYSMTGTGDFKEIPKGGKMEHGTLGEESYTNQAKSYGQVLGLDRRDMINDDLGMFKKLTKKVGRAGGVTLAKKGWAKFLNNSDFFKVANANVSTGAGSALGLSGLNAANTVFELQTDPDGELMLTTPKLLVVPTALKVTAYDLMDSSKKVATTTANAGLPDGNPFAGMFEVVSSPYMQDSTLTGNSNAAWYLLADPEDVPVLEVAFLNGVEIPMVEIGDMDFTMLGMLVRGVYDFGFELQEFRGGVRSAGS